jgi:PAS domain-containing protein
LIAYSKAMAQAMRENFYNLQMQADELRQANLDLNREIQERQLAEAELIWTKTLLAKTFSGMKDVLFVVDPASRTIIAVNQAVEQTLGYSPEAVKGQNIEFLHINRDKYLEFGRRMFSTLDQQGFFILNSLC